MTVHYAASIADIDEQRARLRRLLRAEDSKLLTRRPPNGDWSILENVRHLLFAEQLHLGQFLQKPVAWSPLGISGKTAGVHATIGRKPTTDIDGVFAEWDAIHKSIRKALKSAEGAESEKALWRNHRHLRIHTDVIERLLRKLSA